MAVVNLQIVQPVNGAILEGSGAVSLRGAITSSGHPGAVPEVVFEPRRAADPVVARGGHSGPSGGDASNFAPAGGLPLGSQTIVLAAKDQLGDSPAELQAVKHAGMSRGPAIPANPAPCIVHVLIADLRAPASGATLSKAGAVLDARAPSQWPRAARPGPAADPL